MKNRQIVFGSFILLCSIIETSCGHASNTANDKRMQDSIDNANAEQVNRTTVTLDRAQQILDSVASTK